MRPNSTSRFSDRADDYRRFRPSYPDAAVEAVCGRLPASPVVADLGSGTGIFSALLLKRGCRVFAVEPNEAMRQAAEGELGATPGFTSVAAPAEATTLLDASVDGVTAAQAFHWFDRDAVRAECRRILRPDGWVFILFNERLVETTPFLRAFEALLLEKSADYAAVDHRRVDAKTLEAFFGHKRYESHSFEYRQVFDWEGLAGRARSASYLPAPGDAGHDDFMTALRALYDAHNEDGAITFHYDTRLFAGMLAESMA